MTQAPGPHASLAPVSSRAPASPPAGRARAGLLAALLSSDAVVGALLGTALTLIALLTGGGIDLAANTSVQIVLTLSGAGLAVVLVLCGRRPGGALSVALFAALALLTALSVAWSVVPQSSWLEANRTLSYLAVFGAGAALATFGAERWAALLGGVALACSAISAYALLVKVFPASLDPAETFGRLRAPFDYWNATGLIGALAMAPCLWAGARPDRARGLRALSVPGLAIAISVVVLSYSRGALLVSIIALGIWFAIVPLRLRGALVLALGGAGGAAISAYALSSAPLTQNSVALSQRTIAGHGFGVLLVLVLAGLLLAALAAAYAMDRVSLPPARRRGIGTALVCAVALLPAVGVVGLALSSRGLTGEISHGLSTLTDSGIGVVGNQPARLTQLGNSRGRYWDEGLTVGSHAWLRGTGALGYGTAVRRYTHDPRVVAHAHSYIIETFADFGAIGLAVSLALLIAWGRATRHTLSAGAKRGDAERSALLTLLVVVVAYGLHSTIDWTWFIPGVTLPALLCAGWLAGRGPARGRRAEPESPVPPRARPALGDLSPAALAGSLAIVALSLFACWAVWQPLRAADDEAAGLTALARGDLSSAISHVQRAATEDPVGIEPLLELAAIYEADRQPQRARAELVKATQRQSQNPSSWLELGHFDVSQGHPSVALEELYRAAQLDRSSYDTRIQLANARAELARGQR